MRSPCHVPAGFGWRIQQDCKWAIRSTSYHYTPWCSRQNDTILWIPRTKLSTRHDHQALQANDRDKDSRREEVQKDFATRQQLQPNSPNVVRQNTCLSVGGNARANPDARFVRWLTLVSTGPTRPNRLEITLYSSILIAIRRSPNLWVKIQWGNCLSRERSFRFKFKLKIWSVHRHTITV